MLLTLWADRRKLSRRHSLSLHGGQFVNLSTGDNSLLLRRPLGVCIAENNELSLCYQITYYARKVLLHIYTSRAGRVRVIHSTVTHVFVRVEADMLTVNGYLGFDGIKPFIEDIKKYDKSILLLRRELYRIFYR